jgi:hypothetical protein
MAADSLRCSFCSRGTDPSPGRSISRALLATLLWPAMAASAGVTPPAVEPIVAVYRTMMPECGPSSFAIALAPDLGFSFDPGRGGVNYIWQGEFVDLAPTWRAKINQPAELKGVIVYRESVRYPLRRGGANREPKFEFKGYILLTDTVEFHYLLDGVLVQEEIRALPGGRGVVRRFRCSDPEASWSYAVEPQPSVTISSPAGAWNETRTALIAPASREFSVHIEMNPTRR